MYVHTETYSYTVHICIPILRTVHACTYTVEQGKIGQVIILKSKLKLYLGLFHVVLE